MAKKVATTTVDRILKDGPRRTLMNTQYYFCETPTCEVVYFSNETRQYFTKDDVRLRVGLKETEDPIPICYCFGHTVASAREEIARTGRSTVVASITAEIKAGRCACEIKNPSGSCCLGEVSRVVKGLMKEHTRSADGASVSEGVPTDPVVNPADGRYALNDRRNES
jgi:hypothetical protein